MKSLKAVIFDMDGVVVDNHQFHFRAWMEFSKRHNFELNKDIYRDNFNGKTNADLFQMLFGKLSSDQMKKLADEKESLYQEIYREHMIPHKGLIDFLDYLTQKKIKIALGTSAPPFNVDFTLDTLKLRRYFEVIVDGSQVSRGKPDPEIYTLCVHRLGLNSRDCVVFEDSLAGLESGERAGCVIIGVATSHGAWELTSKTQLIIHDFTEARKLLELNF